MKFIHRSYICKHKMRNAIIGKFTLDEKVYIQQLTSTVHWFPMHIEWSIEKLVK